LEYQNWTIDVLDSPECYRAIVSAAKDVSLFRSEVVDHMEAGNVSVQ
jgi:hypothetical protein